MTTELEPITYSDGTQAALDAGVALAKPTELTEGQDYAFVVPAGGRVERVENDLDEYRARPRRKTGTVTVRDAASFNEYLRKHAIEDTEIWADPVTFALVGVINAHGSSDAENNDEGWAGWGDHRVQLKLAKTRAWTAWEKLDGQLLDQVSFAEHLEQRLGDIVEPAGADMLEIAQTFTAKRNIQFDSSQRLASGQTQLHYHEEIEAKAGGKGGVAVPEAFKLGLIPFEGCEPYKIVARLRHRIHDGALRIGYVLDRPEDILRAAFDDIVKAVDKGEDPPVLMGTPVARHRVAGRPVPATHPPVHARQETGPMTTEQQQAREELAALIADLRRAGWTVESEGFADRGLRWKRTVARSPWRKVTDQ